MINATFMNVGARVLIGTGLALTTFALPSFAAAATYAYVNTAGEVRTVSADAPMTAIAIAPGIALHSGVLLLVNPSDGIVGDSVGGAK